MCVFVYVCEDWIKRLSESDPATTDLNSVKTSFTHFHIFQWQPSPASGASAYTVDIIPLFFCYCILPDCDPSDPVWAEADCVMYSVLQKFRNANKDLDNVNVIPYLYKVLEL